MACGYANPMGFGIRGRDDYACVGVPPEKEVIPEPRENGAVIAALGRVLRGLFSPAR